MQLDITQALQKTDQTLVDFIRSLQVNQVTGVIDDLTDTIFRTRLFECRHDLVSGTGHDQGRDRIKLTLITVAEPARPRSQSSRQRRIRRLSHPVTQLARQVPLSL